MILRGNTLGERQKELNAKTNDTVAQQVQFSQIKDQPEESDVDYFFKIDVAAKYKNVDYIIDVLKSGNGLHITRALKKCDWLFNGELAYITELDYLVLNIFPHMTKKIQRKMLKVKSTNVSDESQAHRFYVYCHKEGHKKIKNKFLMKTSEQLKLKFIDKFDCSSSGIFKQLNFFIGNSFLLADKYLEKVKEFARGEILRFLSYLYQVDEEKYLDMLEKYYKRLSLPLGHRITKQITKKYKARILANLNVYVNVLNAKTLAKYSTVDEIKLYAVETLPKAAKFYWAGCSFRSDTDMKEDDHLLILNAVPIEERFQFLKHIFTHKYPGEEFETRQEFFTSGICRKFSNKDKILLSQDFESEKNEKIKMIKINMWYESVNFDEALNHFKEKINKEKATLRMQLIEVLMKASKSEQHLEEILSMFLENYENEKSKDKEQFVKTVLANHNFANFAADSKCWMLLQKLLWDEEVNKDPSTFSFKYKYVTCLYHIINGLDLTEELQTLLDNCTLYHDLKLTDEQKNIFQNFKKLYHLNKLKEIDEKYNDDIDELRKRTLKHIKKLSSLYYSEKENIPDIMMKYLIIHRERHGIIVLRDVEKNFVKRLKKDATTVITQFDIIKENMSDNVDFQFLQLLRKIKVYFAHDLRQDFVNFFIGCLGEFDKYGSLDHLLNKRAVIGIIFLADENTIHQFMLKYAPDFARLTEESLDESNDSIDALAQIQENICRYAFYAQPPILVHDLLKYMEEHDFAIHCKPTVGSLIANLPKTQCLEFVETAVLTAALAIQRYGLRMAFKCLSHEDLHRMMFNVWRTTQDIDLRQFLYKFVFDMVLSEHNKNVMEVHFELFKEMTLDLNDNDDDISLFNFLQKTSKYPSKKEGSLLKIIWDKLNSFPERFDFKVKVLNIMHKNVSKMDKNCVKAIVGHHIDNSLLPSNFEPEEVTTEKWHLVASYLLHFANDEDREWNLDLVDKISKLLENDDMFHILKYRSFIETLLNKCIAMEYRDYAYSNVILERMQSRLLSAKSSQNEYLTLWNLKLALIINKIFPQILEHKKRIIDRKSIIQDGMILFAKEVAGIVQELTRLNIYQPFFLPQVTNKLCELLLKILNRIKFSESEILKFGEVLHFIDGLVEFETKEVMMLALDVLSKLNPPNKELKKAHYKKVFETIKSFPNSEVQNFLNKKFTNTGFKRRRL